MDNKFDFIGTGYGLKKDGTGEIYGFIIANDEEAFIMDRENINGVWIEIHPTTYYLVADEE